MKHYFILWTALLSLTGCTMNQITEQTIAHKSADKLVIAHRGASGYLPEHSIASKAMAFAMGADYPERFPLFKSTFQVSTLKEEIELIQGLNKSTGKNVGIYVEVKAPWFHLSEGRDISNEMLKIVKDC